MIPASSSRPRAAALPVGQERPGQVFGPLADDYVAARPGYPPQLFAAMWERLGSVSGDSRAAGAREPAHAVRILDVGAGTGAATASLLAGGASVLAVEPALPMLDHARAQMGRSAGWIGGVAGRGEALPIKEAWADVVTVAQAFHWLEEAAALAEFARALKPGGLLAILWNIAQADDFTREVWRLVERLNPGHKRPVHVEKRHTPESLAAHALFSVELPQEFAHARRLTVDEYVRYALSWSYVGGALAPPEQRVFERELRGIFERRHGRESREERLLAVAHFARRR
ncbi:MAG TPA: class I SAM-dependent methyltransferase [Gemmatimonadota bacterium]|nr:class I SAM-dependent methyltransferase [Gemmatimonadota bacterium]